MTQVILRIAESQRATQFTGLFAIRCYLWHHSLGKEFTQILFQYLLMTYISGIGYHLNIARRRMIIQLQPFLDTLLTGQYPIQELGKPALHAFRIVDRKRF